MQTELLFELDDLLNVVGENLQLTQTQIDRVETAYESVANWLEQDETFFKKFTPSIFPHGSFRLGTTVKPYNREKEGKNEFDLDFINFLQCNHTEFSPKQFLDELEKRLRENGRYANMIERKNRCIRLNYTDETNPNNQFHMDIQPACPDNVNKEYWKDDHYLRIPDKEQEAWMHSSPKLFAEYAENKAKQVDKIKLMGKAVRQNKKWNTQYYSNIIECKQNLPEVVPYKYKLPLQRAIQLIKRYRDVYFYDHKLEDYKTSSIIITTLSLNSYTNEVSEFEIIKVFIEYTLNKINSEGYKFEVRNPVNHNEIFTDKWAENPKYKQAFVDFITDFQNKCKMISQNTQLDFDLFKKMFGENVIKKSHQTQVDFIQQQRNKNMIYMDNSTGIIKALPDNNTSKIVKNNFYGI